MMRRQATVFLACLAATLVVPNVSVAAGPSQQAAQFGAPTLGSAAAMIVSQRTGEVLYEQNATRVMPIASITKLMSAMVVLEAGQSMSERLTITTGDIDNLKGTGSRLQVGSTVTREELLNIMLMSSENRAASALARNYPGGRQAFINAMNVKARMIGMADTRFADSSGLDPRNISTPRDLVRLLSAAGTYPEIRDYSTRTERYVNVGSGQLRYGNSNGLVREDGWHVTLSKTGYIREAGRCLVMETTVGDEPVVMVLLNAQGAHTRVADAKRVKAWLENAGGVQRVAGMSQHGG